MSSECGPFRLFRLSIVAFLTPTRDHDTGTGHVCRRAPNVFQIDDNREFCDEGSLVPMPKAIPEAEFAMHSIAVAGNPTTFPSQVVYQIDIAEEAR